ncbi:hypothetical protein YN1_1620 [Nanoarchaeota archaeon]
MVFKNYNVKIRKIVKSRKRDIPPLWAALRKFGRIVYPARLK